MISFIDSLVSQLLNIFKPHPVESAEMKLKVLFISKSKNTYGVSCPSSLSTGLYNSADHVCMMLDKVDRIKTKIVSVVDNNSIDREVTLFKPHIVIIEALWVVPGKFDVLSRLHPNVTWIIRVHSELAFIAGEGVAMDWISKYLERDNIYVSPNTLNMTRDLKTSFPRSSQKIVFLPNLYKLSSKFPKVKNLKSDTINIGCFGAIRIMKNHLTQAVAAIEFADRMNLKLRFHINATRLEGYTSENILKNIKALFASREDHELVEHEWLSQDDFKKLVSQMDIGLQVSFTETFNMVSADMIDQGIPVVGSSNIWWLAQATQVSDETNTFEISKALERVYRFRKSYVYDSYDNIVAMDRKGIRVWVDTLNQIVDRCDR